MSKYGDLDREIVEHPVIDDSADNGLVLSTCTTTTLNPVCLPKELKESESKYEYDWVCSECGSDFIQEKCWVTYNSGTVCDSCGDGEIWCPDCEEYVDTVFRKDYKEEQLEIGNTVMIAEHSSYYDDGCDNPVAEIGTIISINDDEDDDLPIKVQWKNCTNVYSKEDLVKV